MKYVKFSILGVLFFSSVSQAQFLFHNLYDQERFVLSQGSELKLLYINSECKNCFKELTDFHNLNKNERYIIITDHKLIRRAKDAVSGGKLKNDLVSLIHYDPGQRFRDFAKLSGYESATVTLSGGKVKSLKRVDLGNKWLLKSGVNLWE